MANRERVRKAARNRDDAGGSRSPRRIRGVSKANAALSKALGEEDAIKRQDAKRAYPVSVFISRKTQRLYVRQGYAPILDVPVTFDRADEVIGTHVFTALDYVPNKTEMSWTVVSIPTDGSAKTDSKKSKKDKSAKADVPAPVTVPASQQTAASALERITDPGGCARAHRRRHEARLFARHLRQRHERRDRRVHRLHRCRCALYLEGQPGKVKEIKKPSCHKQEGFFC